VLNYQSKGTSLTSSQIFESVRKSPVAGHLGTGLRGRTPNAFGELL
jgi:hypothetical protein